MSLRITFQSGGSSSSDVLRRKRPTLVTRGSSAILNRPAVSLREVSCAFRESAPTTIVRNLRISNRVPPRQVRTCRKSTGPDESSLISTAASPITGAATTRPAVAPIRSIPRFMIRAERDKSSWGSPSMLTPSTVSSSAEAPTTSPRNGTSVTRTPIDFAK